MCGEVRSLFCIFASHHAGWRLCLARPTMLPVGLTRTAPSGNADSQHSLGFICTDGD
ncbi:hypothetical protein A676_00841 [Salmonella enterica subsp. enterica serovar Enteritidis str. 2010K-0262]|nr:hypothetical protein A672_00351 [Salmonella enterica subsp. enterica serovar Enteritidis str. 08-1080]EPI89523.1 hypothetical protein A676_00841 [Salmonella enterica subsp. enterica serovar Enteritidis str. 2010K-0262]EPI91838.1 hypothetical protein A675_00870 [Salmonella enterica subsp. enterica serovar Enteritidis str. 2009K1726]EPJ01910.1 hypothetical protein A677_01446 [Salmonella enterica subsp. enterica serovar Enteritidis str. 2010K-0267]EPJ05215.1 hypothetical protein A679_00820 [Sal